MKKGYSDVFSYVRNYKFEDEQGHSRNMSVQYSIVLKDEKVQNVFNEYGFSVEKTSEVFNFFSEMYN